MTNDWHRLRALESRERRRAFFEFARERGLGFDDWSLKDQEDFARIAAAISEKYRDGAVPVVEESWPARVWSRFCRHVKWKR